MWTKWTGATRREAILWIQAGQSNMEAKSSSTEQAQIEPVPAATGYVQDPAAPASTLIELAAGGAVLFYNSGPINHAAGMCARWAELGRPEALVFVALAKGGSALSPAADAVNFWDVNTSGNLWDARKSRIATMRRLLDLNPRFRLRAAFFVWGQGEDDGDAGIAQASYQALLGDLFDRVAAETPVAGFFVQRLGEKSPPATYAANYAAIRAAQDAVIAARADAGLGFDPIGVLTLGDPLDYSDTVHFTGYAQNTIGRALADALADNL